MNINNFAVNQTLEIDGVWKELGQGAAVLVARDNNEEYKKLFRRLMAPYRGAVGLSAISNEEADKVLIECAAETILLDWRGLTDEEGTEVRYSKDKAIEWLTKYKEFRKIIDAISTDIGNYKDNIEEEVKENIKK